VKPDDDGTIVGRFGGELALHVEHLVRLGVQRRLGAGEGISIYQRE